jgi:hypothetical protein
MRKDPWTDREPQPGDFDADLVRLDSRYVEAHPGDPDAKLRSLISVEGEDVLRLERKNDESPALAGLSKQADEGTRTLDLLHGKQTL